MLPHGLEWENSILILEAMPQGYGWYRAIEALAVDDPALAIEISSEEEMEEEEEDNL